MKISDIEFVKVDPIMNIKRIGSLESAARRIREHNRIHHANERNSPIITDILESCARLLEDVDAGKMKYVEYGEWIIYVDKTDDGYRLRCHCSCCGVEAENGKTTKYCANCGAEMKNGERVWQ